MGGGWGKRGSGVPLAQRVRGDLPPAHHPVGTDCPARHCWVSGAVDAEGPLAALVVNLASGVRFSAARGRGARCGEAPVRPSGATELGRSIVGLSGLPPAWLGWKQFRALGAVALDLCAVASGTLDAYIDCSPDAHGPWDYLGGVLLCTEAGAVVVDALGRDLVVLDHDARRTPVAAAYAHAWRREGLSDHSALIVDLVR